MNKVKSEDSQTVILKSLKWWLASRIRFTGSVSNPPCGASLSRGWYWTDRAKRQKVIIGENLSGVNIRVERKWTDRWRVENNIYETENCVWDGHTGQEQRLPVYWLFRSPALRRQELCFGSFKEQENLSAGVKRECRKPVRQGKEYQYSRIGAD